MKTPCTIFSMGTIFFISLFFPLGGAFANTMTDAGLGIVNSLDDEDILLREFKTVYIQLVEDAASGRIAPQTINNASQLAIGLKKKLIDHEARIEALKLDILLEEKRSAAVDELIELSAEQERMKSSFLSELKSLQMEAKVPEATASTDGESETVKTVDYDIEIKPEDITSGLQE